MIIELDKWIASVYLFVFSMDGDSESDDDIEMSIISKGRHDIVIKQEGKLSGGFFKVTKKQYPMYPFHEEKIKCDEYGEIIKPEDYKLAEVSAETDDNKENLDIKKEEEIVRKCILIFTNDLLCNLYCLPLLSINSHFMFVCCS